MRWATTRGFIGTPLPGAVGIGKIGPHPKLFQDVINEPVPKFKPGLVPPFDRLRANETNPFVVSLSNHETFY